MWQFSAKPVITAASTHLLLRTFTNTRQASLEPQAAQLLLSTSKTFPE